MSQQRRWCYYRVFVHGRRKAQAHFIGRHLGSDWGCGQAAPFPFIYHCDLYEDQDGSLYLAFGSEEVSGWPDYARIRCTWGFLKAKTREELVDRYREFAKANGIDNPVIPPLIVPVPEIEDMHTVTGYDS